MSKPDQVLRLLIIEQQLEQAEFLISHIRNGGIVVRPERAEDFEQLQTMIEQSEIDMVLASTNCEELPIVDVCNAIKKLGKDLPVILAAEHLNDDLAMRAIIDGVTDIALRNRPKHLQFVIRHQFKALCNRRALRHFEADLRESERRCDALIESSRDPIAYIHDGMHIRANESYLQMFGYEDFGELEGIPILDLIEATQQTEFKQIIKNFGKTRQCPSSILVNLHPKYGKSAAIDFEMMPAIYDGESCMQLVARPQLHDNALTEQLRELKDHDPITGLLNRKYFMARLEDAVLQASSGKSHQAVLILSPDLIEQRDRSLGLNFADSMMVEFAKRLPELVGDDGECCHYRDHILAVLCNDSRFEATRDLASRLHAAFDNILLEIEEQSVSFSVCIAAVQITEQNASVPEILKTAGRLLQSMEGLGGNRFDVFDPSAGERANAELDKAWKVRLVRAIENDEFALSFQPIINLQHQESIESYELRIRLPSGDDTNTASPDHFMPIAQNHGLIAAIDQWVVRQAVLLLAERAKNSINTQFFVNISPDSLLDNTLVELIASLLMRYEVDGRLLVLQLPESAIITRLKDIQTFSKSMDTLGVRLCLSQFGTSIDSLKMLSHFDADIIKIDRSFIEDLDKNTANQAKIRDFVQHASNLKITTMAEFVSDASTISILFSIGVDWIQGNFLSPPLAQMNYDFNS